MTDATTAAPRWRTWAKILLTIVITIIAVPFVLIQLFGSVQDRR